MELRERLNLQIDSQADLSPAGRRREIGVALDADPDFAPDRMGSRDPARTPVTSAADDLEAWQPAFKRGRRDDRFLTRVSAPDAGGGLSLNKPPWPRDLMIGFDAGWFASGERLGRLATWFGGLCAAMDAYYGRVAFTPILRQEQDLRGAARSAGTIQFDRRGGQYFVDERAISDVYWLNFFGPATIEMWGIARVDSLGLRQESTPNGGRVIWATETPFVHDPGVTAMTDYPWKRPFYDALGIDTFLHEHWQDPGPGVRVPTFERHRLATLRR